MCVKIMMDKCKKKVLQKEREREKCKNNRKQCRKKVIREEESVRGTCAQEKEKDSEEVLGDSEGVREICHKKSERKTTCNLIMCFHSKCLEKNVRPSKPRKKEQELSVRKKRGNNNY